MHTVWYDTLGMAKSPEQTRRLLLEKAYHEIHLNGFQGTSISSILDGTDLTKGALYHHFKNKNEIGYAVVDEVIRDEIQNDWVVPLSSSIDPVTDILNLIDKLCEEMDEAMLQRGCPLNNLIAEMSPIDPIFREKLHRILSMWRNCLKDAFSRGLQNGNVHKDVNPEEVSHFLIVFFEGISSMTQSVQNSTFIEMTKRPFAQFLFSLKP